MRKASSSRHPTVCLLSSHPLVLAELERLLSSSGFRLQVRRLESTLAPGLERLSLPRAQVFVIDAHAPRQATEVLVAAIQFGPWRKTSAQSTPLTNAGSAQPATSVTPPAAQPFMDALRQAGK